MRRFLLLVSTVVLLVSLVGCEESPPEGIETFDSRGPLKMVIPEEGVIPSEEESPFSDFGVQTHKDSFGEHDPSEKFLEGEFAPFDGEGPFGAIVEDSGLVKPETWPEECDHLWPPTTRNLDQIQRCLLAHDPNARK